MPNITTHNFFAKDLLKKCPSETRNSFKEKQNFYELFAQGFDPFFFRTYLLLKKEIADYCHKNYTDTFFLNFIEIIKKKNLQKDPSVLAALYGHLAHYTLDSIAHPYIIYKTGEYKKKKKETLKYNGKHTHMEMQIDAFFYEHNSTQKFKDFPIHKYLITKEKFNQTLLNVLNENYLKTFHIKKGGNKYQVGCRLMYFAYKYLIEDKTGIKTFIYKQIDKITPRKKGVYEYFSSHITEVDLKIFNLEKKTWYNPWDNNIKSNETFFELYDKAIQEGTNLFKATYQYLNDEITTENYKTILKDKAYTTGFSWRNKSDIQYLEF